MPRITTRGAASALAFGELNALGQVAEYVESVFSTYLYTGTGSDQTLTTGVDLSTYGGMIWSKRRSAVENHFLQDTNRGLASRISSNTTGAAATTGAWPMNAISTTGMTVSGVNYAAGGETYVSWTFRKQPKFFDVVTYTGNGDYSQQVNHLLGSIPGAILMKCTSLGGTNWVFACRRNDTTYDVMYLNTTGSSVSGVFRGGVYGNATQFGPGWFANVVAMNDVNANGATYVAYLFADNAGGFGLTGTDNVISCGSFTTDGSGNATVNLGYEPQFLITKNITSAESWYMVDNMRGWFSSPSTLTNFLSPNSSAAELTWGAVFAPTATGFTYKFTPSATHIYIAIRRGPMKTPTSGTSVFSPFTYSGNNTNRTLATSVLTDASIISARDINADMASVVSRLVGQPNMYTAQTLAETSSTSRYQTNPFDVQTGLKIGNNADAGLVTNGSGYNYISWNFRRAPGFFDVVCYTGDGTYNPRNHNLTVTPDLVILKSRSAAGVWDTSVNAVGLGQAIGSLQLNSSGTGSNQQWAPWSSYFTSTTFTPNVDTNGVTYVAYLFASCPGVSKVFSYTGNGTSQTINCGFTAGARFVLVKRTDSTGNWLVVDTARGLVAAGDPTLYLNSTAAEVTGVDWIDPDPSGFIVNQEATMNANVLNGTYIGLAVS